MEVVPTQLRGQGNALANASAQIANIFAPQIVYSSVIDPRMPFILMGFGGVLGAIIAIFLPETAGIKLPDTISEAEDLFQRKKFLNLSLLKISPIYGATEKSSIK